MIRLWTQQGKDFDLTDKGGRLDPSRSQYAGANADSTPDYCDRLKALFDLVGTDQFIWCVDSTSHLEWYRPEPLFEWLIEVEQSAILGYVRDDPWSDYITGKTRELANSFSRSRPTDSTYSVLVQFPLLPAAIKDRWDLETKPPTSWRPRVTYRPPLAPGPASGIVGA